MDEYLIYKLDGRFAVYAGTISYGSFVKRDIVFTGAMSDCYAWIKARKEGLLSSELIFESYV